MPFTPLDVVIFGKTYPEPSRRHWETVCTGGLRLDTGRPVRLYPVHLRYLQEDQQYRLWEQVTVQADRNPKDQRPESYKIDPARTVCHGVMGTADEWRARRDLLDLDRSWHYGNMDALLEANRTAKTSIGMVVPGTIEEVRVQARPASEREEFEAKCRNLRALKESDLFDPEYRKLDFLPNDIVLEWRCREACVTCARNPHRMKVLDWGLLELARRDGWTVAVDKLREISDLKRYDFRLFLGNFAQHPRSFGVIALWYPKYQAQRRLF